MKSTAQVIMSITTNPDDMKRILIPKTIRKEMGIFPGTDLEQFAQYGCFIIQFPAKEDPMKQANLGLRRNMDKQNRITLCKDWLDLYQIEPKDSVTITLERDPDFDQLFIRIKKI